MIKNDYYTLHKKYIDIFADMNKHYKLYNLISLHYESIK